MVATSFLTPTRRSVLAGLAGAAAGGTALGQSRQTLELATGAPGGAFFDYGPALARVVAHHAPLELKPRVTAGSNENLRLLAERAVPLGLVNMGPAFEAWTGTAAFTGRAIKTVRALLPMYETPFHVIALKGAGIGQLADLSGKRVGVGPAGGPAETFFRAVLETLGIKAEVVTGTPSDNARQLLAGEIDAFWYGAGIPIAAFQEVAGRAGTVVFGFAPTEAEAFRRRYGYFAPRTIPAGTYAGQRAPVDTVAVWNFLLATEGLDEGGAYRLTRAALEHSGDLAALLPAAAASRRENALANTFLPFHPGAARFYREVGIAIPRELAQ